MSLYQVAASISFSLIITATRVCLRKKLRFENHTHSTYALSCPCVSQACTVKCNFHQVCVSEDSSFSILKSSCLLTNPMPNLRELTVLLKKSFLKSDQY